MRIRRKRDIALVGSRNHLKAVLVVSLTLRSVIAVGEVEHFHARGLGRLSAVANDVARGHPPRRRAVRLPQVLSGLAGLTRLEGKKWSTLSTWWPTHGQFIVQLTNIFQDTVVVFFVFFTYI